MQSIQIWEIFSFQRRHYSTATPWPSKLALLSKADPKTASGADKLQISLSHTAVLLQQRIGVYFSYGLFFPHLYSHSEGAGLGCRAVVPV